MLFLILLLLSPTEGFNYETGHEHHYTYSSTSDTLGMHNVTTVLKFRIRKINESDTGIKFHQLSVDSFVQHAQNGEYADNPFKWDLTKSFLFEMEPDGLVHFVHYHQEDKTEMVTLKKALVGTMSAKFQRGDNQTWRYSSTDGDHGGYLDHKYEGKKTTNGYTLTRHHTSSQTVLRTHKKVMYIDHSDNIKEIKAFDNITMNGDVPATQRTLGRSKSFDNVTMNGDAPATQHTLGSPLPVDRDIKVYSSGDFPGISATAETRVHLTLKRKVHSSEFSDNVSDGLVRDSIVVTKKPSKPTTLKETGVLIKDLITCVQRHENKYAPNRTHCVRNLTREVSKLDQESFLQLSHSALNKTCRISDIKCLEERYLMIDVISQMRSNVSQQILVDYVLERNTSVEEVRRCLIHSIATKQPTTNLVKAVEHLCLGKNHSFHGNALNCDQETCNKDMTLTQKRACLTLGALAKNLKDIENDTEAQRIVEKFETWLGIHNEEEFKEIVKPRERRSIGRKYHDRDNHVALKRSLIHVLGNAGHPRSLQHITSYMELNKANPELRRAATQALRQFTCNESAAHLLRSTLFDSEDVVRNSAYEIYVEHPESKQLTKEQEDAVLAQHYTYPIVTRVRRGTIADILKALSFHLGMPKFDWSKTVGKPFKGKFELKVDNLAFAEVNVGLIGRKFDIFRVSLCYKKKVEYDLNVLKDFGFDDIQNVATVFDRLYDMIIDPIVEAVKTILELIEMVKEMTFVQLVKEIIQIFKNLPDIIHDIVESVVTAYNKLIDYDGYPLIDRFKKVVNRVKTFINDIKSDVLGFYHSIADAMTVTLPFVAHEMGEGFILIKDSWKFWENPVQSFNGIEMALLKFKLAVATFIEAKNRIMDSCFFAKGQTPYWFHPVVEIKGILADLKDIHNMTKGEIHDIYHNPTASSSLSPDMITDGFNVNGSKRFIQETIKGVVEEVNSTLSGVINLAKPFWEKISHLMDMFKKIKHAYTFLRDVYHKGKYYMQKLFGSKFHRNFPKIPASCGAKCGCGKYPRDNKGRKGVDLAFKPAYQNVVNPFHGIVHRISDSEVLVRPSRADLAMYEVVVSGFELDMVIDEGKRGTFIKAGKRIGVSTKLTECDTNFLFVSMRKRPNNTESISGLPADSYSYIDPAPYLKKRFPRPGHKSTCNGFSYYYIGMNAEDGTMTGDPKEKKEKIKRPTKGNKSKTPFGQRGSSSQGSKSKPPVGQRGKNRQGRSVENQQEHPTWMQTFKEKFHNMTGKFDKYKNILSKVKVKSFLPKFHIDDKPLTELKHLLAGSPLIQQLDDIVKEVANKLRTEPLMYPDGMPLQQIRRKLKKAHTTVTGDRLSMIDKLLEMAVHECHSFEHAIIAGYGHYCEAHEDCHGITCGMVFRDGFKRALVKVDVRLDSCSNQLHITIKDQMINFTLTSQKQIMVVDLSKKENKELVFDISIDLSLDRVNVTLSGAVCSSTHYSCFEDVELLKDLTISTQNSVCYNKQARDPFEDRVYSLTLPDLLEEVSEFGLDMTKCLVLINEIRNATLYALMELREKGEHVDGEFPEKEDFCFEGSLPLAELDMQIINPGPNKMFGFTPPGIEFQFFVGPVTLELAFGATARMGIDLKLEMCIMSMKAKAVVTPHISTSVWGSIKVDIGFAYGGIKLEGHLLETSFPITAQFGFGKFPIKIGFRLDLEIVPLELKLKAFAKLRLIFVTVTVFDACIWKYKLPTYKINIFNKPYEKRDPNPPRISAAATNPRQRRSSPGGCEVKQLEGHDITDTAFLLEVSAKSDVSEITLSYAIGTHRSGTNVQDWTGMTGNSLTAPVKLDEEHYGIPLYWTVKAKNSQGDSSITECNLKTFDNTVPDGRIDESYPYTSHTKKISGNVVVFDDSELVDTHSEAVGFTKSQEGSGSEVLPLRNAANIPWKSTMTKVLLCFCVFSFVSIVYSAVWFPVFVAFEKNGQSVYDSWRTPSMCSELPTILKRTDRGKHLRNHVINHWTEANIKMVKVELYLKSEPVVWMTFNAKNSNNLNWFSKKNLYQSSFVDLTPCSTTNYFSAEGHFVNNVHSRRFYINEKYNGCPNDYGWFCVEDKHDATGDYEEGKLIIVQTPIDPKNKMKPQTVHREIVGDELVMTLFVGDVVCKRYFRKIT
ncbi:unnamed protein product [Mytilus coruscus]|uniref:Vitellogenin domain-containing protein n=1 Tax=Mytilus coruscus TaxID=42192 RepID=A0A6J8CS24_MYTCO|nr:unnamed protein product [Mytilus coruscus]